MKFFKLAILLVFSFQLNYAQNNVLNGIITQHNSGNRPIAGVQVIADSANPTVSQFDGKFSLVFYKVQPGCDVKLALEYKDWVVVNEKELTTKLPNNPNHQLLRLYMCTRNQLAQSRLNYYEIFIKNSVSKFNKEINSLDPNDENYYTKKEKLYIAKDSISSLGKYYAKIFSQINLDNAKTTQIKADSLYKIGMISEAINLIDEKDPLSKIQNANKIKQNADSSISEYLNLLIQKARLCVADFQLDSAIKTYEDIFSFDSTNAELIIEYANFLNRITSRNKAIKYYKIALKEEIDDFQRAYICNNLGIIYSDRLEYSISEDYYLKALQIFEIQSLFDPDFYQQYLILVLNNLGNIYFETKNFEAAKLLYLNADNLFKSVELNHPKLIELKAAVLLNKGNFYSSIDSFNIAENAYNESYELISKLVFLNNSYYETKQALILINLGNLKKRGKDYENAKKLYEDALVLLEKYNNIDFPPNEEIASVYYNLGQLCRLIKCELNSIEYFHQALNIWYKNKDSSHLFESNIAKTWYQIGTFYLGRKQSDSANYALQKAWLYYEKLNEINPLIYESELAEIYNDIGVLYYNENSFDSCQYYMNKSIISYEKLVCLDSNKYLPLLATKIISLGKSFLRTNEFNSAQIKLQNGLTILEYLPENIRKNYHCLIGETYYNLSKIIQNPFEFDSAEFLLKSAQKNLELCNDQSSEEFQRVYSNTLGDLVNLYYNKNNIDSINYFLKNEFITRINLIKYDTINYGPSLLKTSDSLLNYFIMQNNYDTIEAILKIKLKVESKLIKYDSIVYSPDYVKDKNKLNIIIYFKILDRFDLSNYYLNRQLFDSCEIVLNEAVNLESNYLDLENIKSELLSCQILGNLCYCYYIKYKESLNEKLYNDIIYNIINIKNRLNPYKKDQVVLTYLNKIKILENEVQRIRDNQLK